MSGDDYIDEDYAHGVVIVPYIKPIKKFLVVEKKDKNGKLRTIFPYAFRAPEDNIKQTIKSLCNKQLGLPIDEPFSKRFICGCRTPKNYYLVWYFVVIATTAVKYDTNKFVGAKFVRAESLQNSLQKDMQYAWENSPNGVKEIITNKILQTQHQ